MSLLRRLTVVVNSCFGNKSLACVDLTNQLFGNTTPPPATTKDESESAKPYSTQILESAAALKLESSQIPSPIVNYHGTPMRIDLAVGCFPLTDGKVVFSDQFGRTLLVNGETRQLVTMPTLHKPKRRPISLFVPSADADDHQSGGGRLYIMEQFPIQEMDFSTQLSDQFEVLVCGKLTASIPWHCQLLPPPPFVRDLTQIRRKIISYAVVGSDIYISAVLASQIHISPDCAAPATYRLDTVRNIWYELGEWMLPFYGKVEYVPELKLLFGLSAQTNNFAAADFATMDSPPQLLGDLKEFEPPEEWQETYYLQLIVNLGSGRFCIARFFETTPEWDGSSNWIVVLTGVEATRLVHDNSGGGIGNGKVKLTKHKSRCHISESEVIGAVF